MIWSCSTLLTIEAYSAISLSLISRASLYSFFIWFIFSIQSILTIRSLSSSYFFWTASVHTIESSLIPSSSRTISIFLIKRGENDGGRGARTFYDQRYAPGFLLSFFSSSSNGYSSRTLSGTNSFWYAHSSFSNFLIF